MLLIFSSPWPKRTDFVHHAVAYTVLECERLSEQCLQWSLATVASKSMSLSSPDPRNYRAAIVLMSLFARVQL